MEYLTRIEIIRRLHLPDSVGRIKFEMWRKQPGFPSPEPATGGRWWWPQFIAWLQRQHGVEASSASADPSFVHPGKENFDEWRAKRRKAKAAKTGGPEISRADLSTARQPMGNPVVTPFRRGEARLQQDNIPPVAGDRTGDGAA